jgi:hypothetical protein
VKRRGQLLVACGLVLAAAAGAGVTYLLMRPMTAPPPPSTTTQFLAGLKPGDLVRQAFPAATVREERGGDVRDSFTGQPHQWSVLYTAVLDTGAAGGPDMLKVAQEVNALKLVVAGQVSDAGGLPSMPGFSTTAERVHHADVTYRLGQACGCVDIWATRVDQPGGDLVIVVRVIEVH